MLRVMNIFAFLASVQYKLFYSYCTLYSKYDVVALFELRNRPLNWPTIINNNYYTLFYYPVQRMEIYSSITYLRV